VEEDLHPLRVALLDRNERFLRALEGFLADHSDEVTVVGARQTLAHAGRYIEECGPEVVLVGIGLPGTKAIELISELRAARLNGRIVALTLLEDGYAQAARSAGADDVVLKERVSTDLIPAMRRLAQRCPPSDARGHADLLGLHPLGPAVEP